MRASLRLSVSIVAGAALAGGALADSGVRLAEVPVQDLANVPGWLSLQAHEAAVATDSLPNLLADDAAFASDARYVLQLDGPLTPARRTALQQAGVALGDYLPNFAYLVRFDRATPQDLRALGFVQWVGDYRNDWKIAPGIGARPYASDDRQDLREAGRVVVDVTLFDGADEAAGVAAILAGGAANLLRVDRYGAQSELGVELPLADVPALAAIAEVQFVEEAPDVSLRNNTTRWIAQTNTSGDTPLYDVGIRGGGQIAGVMDGKIDSNHCSFAGKIVAYNTAAGSNSHGTHVGATVVGDNGAEANTRGIAYEGQLVFDDVPSFTDTAMYNSLQLHHDQGARVHTNSWGDDGTTAYNGLTRGVDRFSYDNEDSLVLFAVTNLSSLRNPDNAKNLLAVGASQDTPNQASHCSGGVGPTADGRRKPEAYLPGCGTTSAASSTACSTTSMTGTSMACPAVAGAALLVRQYYVDGFYPSGSAQPVDAFSPSGALVKATVLNACVDMTGVSGYPSNLEGWGRVRLDRALPLAGDSRALFIDDLRNADGLNTGEFVDYEIDVTDSGNRLKVTLVWTDPPAASGASSAAINDLDLEVIAPDATLYRGNVFSGGVSASGGTADAINNVEQAHFNTPATGLWTIRIRANAVNVGTQGYAIVASGAVTPDVPFSLGLPAAPPNLVQPGTSTDFTVEIVPGNENITTAELLYSIDGGSLLSSPLTPDGGDNYRATLPALDCNQTIDFHVAVSGDGGTTRTEPVDYPASTFSAEVGVEAVPLDDMFETDSGWTVGAPGDTATAGIWNRMDPEATAAQPEDDHSPAGTDCWVTDGLAGAGLGSNDVDGGATTLTSPTFDLTGAETALISYWRWFSNDAGATPRTDVFTVDITDDGVNWVNVETVGPDGAENSGGWIQHAFNVADFVALTSTVQVRFIAADAADPSLVEAAIDDFLVRTRTCDDAGGCLTDTDGSGTVDLTDLATLLSNFGNGGATAADGDSDGDGDVDLTDLANLLAEFGATCS